MAAKTVCPTCGSPLGGGPFCAMCGTRVDGAGEPAASPAGYYGSARQLFRSSPRWGIAAAALVALAIAVVLMATGEWVIGVAIVAALAVAIVFALGATGGEKPADAAAPRPLGGLRDRASVAAGSYRTWTNARRRVLRLRQEVEALRGARRGRLADLGEAVVADDAARVAELRGEVESVDADIASRESEIAEIVETTRREVERERLTVAPTEAVEAPPPEPEPELEPEPEPEPPRGPPAAEAPTKRHRKPRARPKPPS